MRFLFILVLAISWLPSFAQHANEREHIQSFKANITIDNTGGLLIKETIIVQATGDKIKRGIFRSLPTENGNRKDAGRRLSYDLEEVLKDGVPEKNHTEKSGGNFTIYIGDKDVFLEPGLYHYSITYKVKNQVAFLKDLDELYWNVNGNSWDFDADTVSATVTLPAGAHILHEACYTGAYGNAENKCTSKPLSDQQISWLATGLQAREGLTVAVGFNKGIIPEPPPPSFFELHGVKIFSALSLLTLLGFCFYTWRKFGVDPPSPAVYPQFNVPQNYSPAVMGMILKEKFDNDFFVAAIVNLAIKGYLRIEEVNKKVIGIFNKKSFELHRLRPNDKNLAAEEDSLLSDLFSKGETLAVESTYNEEIKRIYDNFKSRVKKSHHSLLNKGNNSNFLLVAISMLIWGLLFLVSLIIGLAMWPAIIAFLIVFITIPLFLVNNFNRWKRSTKVLVVLGGYAVLTFCFYQAIKSYGSGYVAIRGEDFLYVGAFFLLSILFTIFYGYFIKRPAEEKLQIQSLIKGFGMYLGTAEEKQLQYFNPPQVTPEVFEKLLPYAMVLGVDEIWGEKFERNLRDSISAPQYHSGWYTGSTFSPSSFGKSFNSSFGSAVTSAVTPPHSGSGGSSGGGFSGGGGGGGGGGGW